MTCIPNVVLLRFSRFSSIILHEPRVWDEKGRHILRVTPGPSENKLNARFMVTLHFPDTKKPSAVSVILNNVPPKGDTRVLDVNGTRKKPLVDALRGKGLALDKLAPKTHLFIGPRTLRLSARQTPLGRKLSYAGFRSLFIIIYRLR